MKICRGILLITILLFTGCDMKDVAKEQLKAELEKQIQINKFLENENKNLKQELEYQKNRLNNFSNKAFK
jgi:cell division protein FtsB